MKLTDLRHLETSKEEMKLLKGGDDDPEKAMELCSAGCDCTAACIKELGDKDQTVELMTNSRTNSSAMNKVWGVVTAGVKYALGI